MSQLNKWMAGQKVSKLVVVVSSKENGEHIERWQFEVRLIFSNASIIHLTSCIGSAEQVIVIEVNKKDY